MADHVKYRKFTGRMVIVGFGSIGQGVLPLFLRHLDIDADQITIITAEPRGRDEAAEYGITFIQNPLTPANHVALLENRLSAGDLLVNLSVDVSSMALVEFCLARGILYIDTCIEPWPGFYTDAERSASQRSNYALREGMLALRKQYPDGPTALVTHGANPGLVSHFVKQALLNIAADTGVKVAQPTCRAEWAALSQRLGIKVIHIAERDTQASRVPKKPGEFVNTWSIDGFVDEGCQPAELGWGSHEKLLPADGRRHDFGPGAAIYLMRPGASTRVRTWTPREGSVHGFLITHSEAISIADFLSIGDGEAPTYRPTVHYAYHPCDDAVLSLHEFAGKNWKMPPEKRLMMNEIVTGVDELGVLLMGHAKGAYWYGSQLSIDTARRLAPHNNATSMQVTVAVLAGAIWALENPASGVIEPDEIDYRRCLEICRPYLGKLVGAYSDWTPLLDRGRLFPEDVDRSDPWQFQNFRVV